MAGFVLLREAAPPKPWRPLLLMGVRQALQHKMCHSFPGSHRLLLPLLCEWHHCAPGHVLLQCTDRANRLADRENVSTVIQLATLGIHILVHGDHGGRGGLLIQNSTVLSDFAHVLYVVTPRVLLHLDGHVFPVDPDHVPHHVPYQHERRLLQPNVHNGVSDVRLRAHPH